MLTKPIPEFFKGPLGSHRNYITYIAFPNYAEYLRCKKQNEEQSRSNTATRYGEFRLLLNAVESLNNILDYLFSEHNKRIKRKTLYKFKDKASSKYPVLKELADLANAYKHCGRWDDCEPRKRKHAGELQKTHVTIHINVSNARLSCAEYQFCGPLPEHENTLNEAFKFWLDYCNAPTKLDEVLNV